MKKYLLILIVFLACTKSKVIVSVNNKFNDGYSIINSYKKPITEWPKPIIDKGIAWDEMKPISINMNYIEDQENPEVILGKILFFDPKLSSSNQVSCSSCHHPEMGWTTHTEKALGHDHILGSRNTPTILNVAFKKFLFWDGRASSLEEQAVGPIQAHNEMNMKAHELPQKLRKYPKYQELFQKAFPSEEIEIKHILKSLASFERTIKSQPSRFDGFLKGNYNALTNQEINGLHLFRTKARCMNCHNGQYFTDHKFHNIGLTYYKREYEDLGRYNITKNPDDIGRFLTPSLRDLFNTRPWMHNGFLDDMTGILNIYNSGMQVVNPTLEEKAKDPLFPVVDKLVKPLNLTNKEIDDVVSFLHALNGTKYKMAIPNIPR